jgi:DME family drug/metabolite transporter
VILPGGLAFVGFQLGYFLAANRVGVATATIVTIGVGPLAAGLLDRVRRGTALRVRWWVGVVVAAIGIAVTTGADILVIDPTGWAAAIAAGCCFPFFGDAIRTLTADRPALTAVATVFGAAIVPAALLLVFAGTDPLATRGTTLALLYLGLVTTAAAYALWSAGLAVLSLGDTVTLTMIEPVAATALAVAILREPAGTLTVVGVLVTLLGVWIATAPTAASAKGAGELARSSSLSPARSPRAGWLRPGSR